MMYEQLTLIVIDDIIKNIDLQHVDNWIWLFVCLYNKRVRNATYSKLKVNKP